MLLLLLLSAQSINSFYSRLIRFQVTVLDTSTNKVRFAAFNLRLKGLSKTWNFINNNNVFIIVVIIIAIVVVIVIVEGSMLNVNKKLMS